MADEATRRLLSSGEVSESLRISKQALNFYRKKGLIDPVSCEDNNYFYYSLTNQHILEIITTLRKLEFSVQEIKAYLTDRNPAAFTEMIDRKKNTIQEKIAYYEFCLQSLQEIEKRRDWLQEIDLNHPKICHLRINDCIYSSPQEKNTRGKTSLLERFSFINEVNRKNIVNYKRGWLLNREDFLAKRFFDVINYIAVSYSFQSGQNFTNKKHSLSVDENEEDFVGLNGSERKQNSLPRRFCCYYGQGNYHKLIDVWADKMIAFIKHRKLEIDGDVMVLFIKDYWFTKEKSEYVFQILLPLK